MGRWMRGRNRLPECEPVNEKASSDGEAPDPWKRRMDDVDVHSLKRAAKGIGFEAEIVNLVGNDLLHDIGKFVPGNLDELRKPVRRDQVDGENAFAAVVHAMPDQLKMAPSMGGGDGAEVRMGNADGFADRVDQLRKDARGQHDVETPERGQLRLIQ